MTKVDYNKFTDLWNNGLPVTKIATELGIHWGYVYKLREKLDLKPRPRLNPTGLPPVSQIGKAEWDYQYRQLRHKELNASRRRYIRNARKKLMKFLCNGNIKCNVCEINDIQVLTFDHIHNNGKDDREYFANSDKMVLYYVQHPEEAKKELQVLCRNCNWIKRLERRTD